MANFLQAFEITAKWEGGYANHEADKGGETYKGIARKFHASFPGWKYIDAVTQRTGKNQSVWKVINEELAKNTELQKMIKDFYFGNFWVKAGCDRIKDQSIANFVYDFAVNSGVSTTVKKLQEILNKHFGQKLVVDGGFGQLTEAAVNGITDTVKLHKLLVNSRIEFVNNIIKNNPSQSVFINGWLSRIKSFVLTNAALLSISGGGLLLLGTLFF